MNRGIRGEYIFPGDGDKQIFLEILSEKAKLLGVHLIGYCVMNNHFHVLLENSSGRMSSLLKVVNGSYGRPPGPGLKIRKGIRVSSF
jgi:REP element-mobilizing transposase RayT